MHVLLTRPEADARACRDRLEALGHAVSIEPLLAIEHCAPADAVAGANGLIVTSRHALEALADARLLSDAVLGATVFTVGRATAGVARALGFQRIETGVGTGNDMVELVRRSTEGRSGFLVYLSGEEIACDIAAALAAKGFAARREIVYRSMPAEVFSTSTRSALGAAEIDAVLLMSARTADTYARLVAKAELGPRLAGVCHLCLSPEIARRLASLAIDRVRIAHKPTSDSLLDLVTAVALEPQ